MKIVAFLFFFFSCMYLPNGLGLGRSDVMPLLKTFLKDQKVGKYPLNTQEDSLSHGISGHVFGV